MNGSDREEAPPGRFLGLNSIFSGLRSLQTMFESFLESKIQFFGPMDSSDASKNGQKIVWIDFWVMR
jgi:hypothetical protein